jgi:chemotaxis protein histidine kinase CheA
MTKIPVNLDTGASVQKLRQLRKEMSALTAGTEEFNKKAAEFRDVEDALESAKIGAQDLAGALEEAPGPIGQIARGFKTLELNTKSFGTALRATGIGLLVSLIGGLVAAFMNSEKAMKKLEPVMIGFQKILGGIFSAFEPVLDVFVEMVEYVLPAFTNLIGGVYSVIYGLFSLITNLGKGVLTILQGIFNNDLSQIGQGLLMVGNFIGKAVDDGLEAYERFGEGAEELTEKEKEELAKRQEQEAEAAQKRKEAAEKAAKEEEDRLKAAQDVYKKYLDAEKDLLVKTDEEKLMLEKQRAQDELDALNLTAQERQKIQDQFNEVYKLKEDELAKQNEQRELQKIEKEKNLQLELQKLRASTTETLQDDADVELSITNKKYEDLIAAAILNNESIVTLEMLKEEELAKIRKDYEVKENERVKSLQDKERANLLASIDQETNAAREKLAIKAQTLEAIISIAGQESAIGKAAFVAGQILRLLELKETATAALTKLSITAAEVPADLAAGAAKTAAKGPPANIPLLILYAAQAAAIVASTISAFSKAKSSISQASGGGSTSAPSTPSIPAAQPISVTARRNQGGFVFGNGGSITDSIPAMLSNGEFVMNARSAEMFSPLLMAMNDTGNLPNTALPSSMGNQSLVDVMQGNMSSQPIRTYVTSQDMSNQQQFDRTIKSRSLI